GAVVFNTCRDTDGILMRQSRDRHMANDTAIWFFSGIKSFKSKMRMSTFLPCESFRTIKHICFNFQLLIYNMINLRPIYLHVYVSFIIFYVWPIYCLLYLK